MKWLYYLAEANLYIGVFYLAYCLFLNRDTHYQLKRGYLLFTCVVSFLLPVMQVGAWRPVRQTIPVNAISYAIPPLNTSTIITGVAQQPQPIPPGITANANTLPAAGIHFTWADGALYLYFTGVLVFVVILIFKLFALFRLVRNRQCIKVGNCRMVYLNEKDIAFSFFNYLFISANMAGTDTITRHELVHIRQKHSADILFLELLKIFNWFNPFIYLLQNSLKTVHEYIADEQTAAYETDALTYSSFLVNNAYGNSSSSIAHSFFNYNLLKKRIIMLNQQRSGNLARLKYLVALPICAGLLCASTLAFSKTYGWVDLAPAGKTKAINYADVNAGHAWKRKRLRITQDGITTITDQLTIGQKNTRVVYNAGTLSKADRSLLLRKHHIKVEVVTDSAKFTTSDGKPVLPVVNVDGYYILDHFLHHNIQYTSVKGEKGGLVEVGFALDKDRHIQDAKIVKSGGPKLDALALNAFTAYKGIVNDDPGKNLKIGVYFFTDDYSIFKTDSLGKDPEFAGELIITNYKYPATITSKGYEYNESNMGFADGSNTKVVIFDSNGEGNWFYKNRSTPADLKMLKDKYGYTFPSASSSIVQLMFPDDKVKKHVGYIFDVESYLEDAYLGPFYNYILDNIQYPKEAHKQLKGGVVVLNFNLDNSGLIGNVKVAQSAGNGFDEAAVEALHSYKNAIKDNAGKHSIAIIFCVAEKQYRPVVSDKIKKDGYVGELAVSDIKSPFREVK